MAFRDTGMPVDEAFDWMTRGIPADRAVDLRDHGWNPHAHSRLVLACLREFARTPARHLPDGREWVEAPVAWWRALRYLDAGLTVDEALGQEQRRQAGEDVDPAIDTLIALNTQAPQ